MKSLLIIVVLFLLSNCNNPKTVMICGDHGCVNKAEAKQYFEENLSIEVKIIDNKKSLEVDLIELNLNNNQEIRKITVSSKNSTKKDLKKLSNKEVSAIKRDIKIKKDNKKISKEIINKEKNIKKDKIVNKNVNKNLKEPFDVCTILEKCSIDEISKYLLKQGKKKGFPDITTRQ